MNIKSLNNILCKLNSKSLFNLLSYNKTNTLFGANNYSTLHDKVDEKNYEWNLIIPGYKNKIKNEKIEISKVIGILWLSNGKHQLFANTNLDGFCNNRCLNDIKKYINDYLVNNNNVKGCWVEPILYK